MTNAATTHYHLGLVSDPAFGGDTFEMETTRFFKTKLCRSEGDGEETVTGEGFARCEIRSQTPLITDDEETWPH